MTVRDLIWDVCARFYQPMRSDFGMRLEEESLAPSSVSRDKRRDGRGRAPAENRGEYLARLRTHPSVTGYHHVAAQPPRFVDIPDSVQPEIVRFLEARGISRLYEHQGHCFRHATAGKDTVVLTPTASGKTLCYNLPVLHRILEDADRRALYLFPTKALTYDQLDDLIEWSVALGGRFRVHAYDGDTPQDARAAVRSSAHIVLTNPDMLHKGVLPHHTKWTRLFENLDYVVIDELHTYRGVFGSHLANVLRRLDRICRFYGSRPRFLCASATIGNPGELAGALTGRDFEVVRESGAPQAEKHVFFYNPPIVNRHLGIRRSYVKETRRIARGFLGMMKGTIVFANSRLITEILVRYLKEDLPVGPGDDDAVVGYRGGYLPRERRRIEKGLRNGEIRGVVSTNALELGVDIGSLDVAVLAGYPGTVASTWQRLGRAGRESGSAVGVLVASSAPIDQYIVNHPDYFLGQSPEAGRINPENIHVLISHLQCATFELPFAEDEKFGGLDVSEILEYLVERGFLHKAAGRWHWTSDQYPADEISLRSVGSDNFLVVETTGEHRVIGEVDYSSAFTTLHEKAIYLHQGQQYYVHDLDVDERRAYVRAVDSEYFTDAITYTNVTPLETAGRSGVHRHGEVHVAHQVVGFKKIRFATMENVGSGELSMPTVEMHTTAYWLTIPRRVLEAVDGSLTERLDGVYGIGYALGEVASVFLMCDRRDLGTAFETGVHGTEVGSPSSGSPAPSRQPGGAEHEPTIYIYDNYPGGIGLSRPLYEMRDKVLAETRALIGRCACEAGCPSCIGPTPGAKQTSLAILDAVLDAPRSA